MVARRAVAAALEQSGYSGYAAHILEEDLAPEMAVYAFERFSCAFNRGRTLALLVSTAAVVRYPARPRAGMEPRGRAPGGHGRPTGAEGDRAGQPKGSGY